MAIRTPRLGVATRQRQEAHRLATLARGLDAGRLSELDYRRIAERRST